MITSALNHSPDIEIKLATSQASMAKYHINSVPTIVINEQYKTNLEMAKNPERLIEVLSYLIELSKANPK